MIIVSIDEQSESQYVNKISSKNSSIDCTAGTRGLLTDRENGGRWETENEGGWRMVVWLEVSNNSPPSRSRPLSPFHFYFGGEKPTWPSTSKVI